MLFKVVFCLFISKGHVSLELIDGLSLMLLRLSSKHKYNIIF